MSRARQASVVGQAATLGLQLRLVKAALHIPDHQAGLAHLAVTEHGDLDQRWQLGRHIVALARSRGCHITGLCAGTRAKNALTRATEIAGRGFAFA